MIYAAAAYCTWRKIANKKVWMDSGELWRKNKEPARQGIRAQIRADVSRVRLAYNPAERPSRNGWPRKS